MPECVPVAALSPVPAAALLAPAPASTTPPASVLKPPAPIPPRIGRDIKNEGHVETPGRMRGETRVMRDALQEYAHRHGVLSTMEHAASNPTIGGGGDRRNISPIAWGMWPKRPLQGVG